MRSFVVKVMLRSAPAFTTVRTRYIWVDGENGSEAIAAAREQTSQGDAARASYHAKPCPPGVVNPWH